MSRSRGRPPSQRQLRVGEEIRHALSEVLGEASLRDPDLAGAAITVTEVRLSPDLKNATAFVMPLGGAEPFLRGELARRLKLRFTPRLGFEPDLSFDNAGRIDALLRGERLRRDPERPDRDSEGAEAGEADHGS